MEGISHCLETKKKKRKVLGFVRGFDGNDLIKLSNNSIIQ